MVFLIISASEIGSSLATNKFLFEFRVSWDHGAQSDVGFSWASFQCFRSGHSVADGIVVGLIVVTCRGLAVCLLLVVAHALLLLFAEVSSALFIFDFIKIYLRSTNAFYYEAKWKLAFWTVSLRVIFYHKEISPESF